MIVQYGSSTALIPYKMTVGKEISFLINLFLLYSLFIPVAE